MLWAVHECGAAWKGGWVALLGHNVLSSWQFGDSAGRVTGVMVALVSGHTAHITKRPHMRSPGQVICNSPCRYDSRPGLLNDIKVRNWVGMRNTCVPLATLFLTALQRLFKALLEKGNNPSHPLWLALPSQRVWWGTLWCAWTSCPWGLQNVGFLPTVLVPVCLLATSLQI